MKKQVKKPTAKPGADIQPKTKAIGKPGADIQPK